MTVCGLRAVYFHPGLVDGVAHPVGPEHQQVVAHAPGDLPPLDAAGGGEAERRRGGLEPLRLAEPRHPEGIGVPRAGVRQAAAQGGTKPACFKSPFSQTTNSAESRFPSSQVLGKSSRLVEMPFSSNLALLI